MLETSERPVTSTSDIVVEIDKDILIDLFQIKNPSDEAAARTDIGQPDSDIVVEGKREAKAPHVTLKQVRELLAERRIVVRGKPRLTVMNRSVHSDHRRKQLTLLLASANDLVVLPSYDKDGNPIFDGPLAGLRAEYERAPE